MMIFFIFLLLLTISSAITAGSHHYLNIESLCLLFCRVQTTEVQSNKSQQRCSKNKIYNLMKRDIHHVENQNIISQKLIGFQDLLL